MAHRSLAGMPSVYCVNHAAAAAPAVTGQFAYDTARVLHTYGGTDRQTEGPNYNSQDSASRAAKTVGRRNQLLDMRNVKYPK